MHVKPNQASFSSETTEKHRVFLHRLYNKAVKLMFIADIVGQPGRRAVKELLPGLRQKHGHGFGHCQRENAAAAQASR